MKIIVVNVSPETENEETVDAGIMYEHNFTRLEFVISDDYINPDNKYYLDFAVPTGVLRTEYLSPDENNTISFDLPANITSQMSAICYFNIVKTDNTTLDTVQVIKPKRVILNFSTVVGTDDELRNQYDFSVNTLLESIENGTFKGDKGDKGEKGDKGSKGDKGDKGDSVQVDAVVTAGSVNPVQSKGIKTYVDGVKVSQVVDCPAFTNQPTITGSLNGLFKTWKYTYYFVHIVDSAAGTFQLMESYNTPSSAVDQIFTLSGLNTGNSGVLIENASVDFVEIGTTWKMRSAGVNFFAISGCAGANEIEIMGNGAINRLESSYIGLTNFNTMTTENYCFTSSTLKQIYNGINGFLLGTFISNQKFSLASIKLSLKKNTKTLSVNGIMEFGECSNRKPTKFLSVPIIDSIACVGYDNTFENLPEFSSFLLRNSYSSSVSGNIFLNGFELNVIRKGVNV